MSPETPPRRDVCAESLGWLAGQPTPTAATSAAAPPPHDLGSLCDRGTVLAVANELGLHAIGVDWSPKRCRQAQVLRTDQPPVPEDSDD